MLSLIGHRNLIIILVLAIILALPKWPYSKTWGYGPSSAIGIVLFVIAFWIAIGRI